MTKASAIGNVLITFAESGRVTMNRKTAQMLEWSTRGPYDESDAHGVWHGYHREQAEVIRQILELAEIRQRWWERLFGT